MKKAISILMVIALLVCNMVLATADTVPFDDVSKDHWAYDAVQYFYNENVIHGVDENHFAPDEYLTREQFAKLLSIIYDKTEFIASEQTFIDVTPDMWSYDYIESVKDYLTGYFPQGGEPFFNPEGKATREDIAYSLVKISGMNAENVDNSVLDEFKDSSNISMDLKSYLSIAVKEGLMQGYDGYLRPQDGITRAEAATLLFRAIKRPVSKDEASPIPTESKTLDTPDKTKPTETDNKTGSPTKIPEADAIDEAIKNNKTNETDKTEAPEEVSYIYSGHIMEFSISGTESYNCDIDDPDAIKGKIELTFGKDALKDTKLYAYVTVSNKDVYEVKSTLIDSYSYTDKNINVGLTFDVYKNGKLIIKDDGTRAVVSKDFDEFVLSGKTSIKGEKVIYSLDNLPDIPEKQPGTMWNDSLAVIFHTTKLNGIDAPGEIHILYKPDEQIAKIQYSSITADGDYTIEISSVTSVTSKEFVGNLTIKKDGEVVADNTACTIPLGDKLKLEEVVTVITDDGNWEFEMKATEINR